MKRILTLAAGAATLFSALTLSSCATTRGDSLDKQFVDPGDLMLEKIQERVAQIPFQHKQELLDNLLWLSQLGEQAIPSLVRSLSADDPKVRSSAAWVLGRMSDKRSIPFLRKGTTDTNEIVRLEVSRSLLLLGDYSQVPVLISGLDSPQQHIRFLCFDALQSSTGKSFDYDHRISDGIDRRGSVQRWQEWWAAQKSESWFQGSALAAPQGR